MTSPQPMNLHGAVDLSALANNAQASAQSQGGGANSGAGPRPGGGAPAPSRDLTSLVVELTMENFAAVVEGSRNVVVLVVVTSTRSQPSLDLADSLAELVGEFGGRLQLAVVDADQQPNIAQALQVQQIPTTVALLAGQPVPLFQGAAPADQLRPVLGEVLSLAEQNGVTGRLPLDDDGAEGAPEEPVEAPDPHARGTELIEAGDLEGAAAYYRQVLAEAPADQDAKIALTTVELMIRTQDLPADAVAQATDPADVEAQLAAADAEFSSGSIEDALNRLLETIRRTSGEERDAARVRLLEYFDILGPADERATKARRALASALY